ncbi:amino acid ABC transporter permease [Staphylococcus pasteuri]|uniref:amino acid ABC transporter permease n=1 Tax=Staphylococcus TaxID=1279 RepID=UPI0008A3D0D9|nr:MULTISPECIES: amino acid ABC transporter permease [Staphylococcus]OFV06501.1 ABC transporter permease [Staphylococcus sp. HMSC13A10]
MSFILHTFIEVLKGVPNTIAITLIAMLIGIIIGTVFAIIRLQRIPVLSQLVIVYNSFFRSTPLIVQLFIFYYGLPALILWFNSIFHTSLNPDMAHQLMIAAITFALHATAYLSESIKGGLLSVDPKQIEAAQTVGLSKWNVYRRIVFPQAFGYALPNIENQFIMLLKGTSLAFAVQVTEIMAISTEIANEGYQFVPVYTVAAIFYWALAIVIEYVFHKIEHRTTHYLTS